MIADGVRNIMTKCPIAPKMGGEKENKIWLPIGLMLSLPSQI
jgi:hypothetical protein